MKYFRPCFCVSLQNQPAADNERVHLIAVPPIDHQAAVVYKQNYKKDFSLQAKSKNLPKHKAPVLLQSFFNKPKCHLQSLPFTVETFGNVKLGDVEESLSEESDALRRAFQSLGFDEDPQQQCENLNMDLQHRKEQMKAVTQENAELKSQLRKTRCEEQTTSDLHSSREKVWCTFCRKNVFEVREKALNLSNILVKHCSLCRLQVFHPVMEWILHNHLKMTPVLISIKKI